MRIAYIELDYHSENLISFCKAFQNSSEDISIFTTERVYKDVISEGDFTSTHWHIMRDESINKFLHNYLSDINSHDIIFFATIESCFYAYSSLKFKPISILRIHMLNSFFNRRKSMSFPANFRELIDWIYYVLNNLIIEKENLHLKRILNRINYFTLTHHNIDCHFRSEHPEQIKKLLPIIPLSVFDTRYLKQPDAEKIYFTIPGNIDLQRRDYLLALNVFKNISPFIKKKTQLILLGKPIGYAGRKIIKEFIRLQTKLLSIKFYTDTVPQKEFNNQMMLTDVILSPLNTESKYKIYREKYGYTKISGNYTDIIRYGKPSIIPVSVPIEDHLKGIIDTYNSKEDLEKILLSYINGDLLNTRSQNILPALKEFSPEKVRDKTVTIFSSVLESKS